MREGITPYEAATAERITKGMHVVADGYEWDSFWIQKLFNEAGVQFEFYFLPFFDAEHLPVHRPHRALRMSWRRMRLIRNGRRMGEEVAHCYHSHQDTARIASVNTSFTWPPTC